ncbi:hypothetical protein F5B17DRAFT_187950 [Nemania serpens]|nr:hypothetical protein F5B17DRAFT_187950 [Nemania serpens]
MFVTSAYFLQMTPPPQSPGNRRPGKPNRSGRSGQSSQSGQSGQSGRSGQSAWPGQLGTPDQLSNAHIDSSQALLRPPSPRGNPILDPNEHNQLGTFFNGLESNEYNMQLLENGLQFSDQWLFQDHGVVPNFLAHSTSYRPQTAPDLALAPVTGWPVPLDDVYTFGQNAMPPQSLLALTQSPQSSPLQQSRPQSQPPPFHYFPHPPQEHFQSNGNGSHHGSTERVARDNAAALLTSLQCGHLNTHSSLSSSPNGVHRVPHILSQRQDSSSLLPSYVAQNNRDPAHTMMYMITGGERSSRRPQPRPEQLELCWGTDDKFAGSQGFVPPQHESSQALEDKRFAMMEGLTLTSSVPNTRAPSPIHAREAASHTTPESHDDNVHVEVERNQTTSPRKRRKSTARMEGEEDGGWRNLPSKVAARKRKSKGDQNGSPELSSGIQDNTMGKRRKSAPSQPKPQRENLTEEQKRENHIKSEQKRRGAIKEGFDDLTFIVPNLQNGGYSKSNVLNMAGDWLEMLIKGNQTLELKGQFAS